MVKWLVSFKDYDDRKAYVKQLEANGYFHEGFNRYVLDDTFIQLCGAEAMVVYLERDTYDHVLKNVLGIHYYQKERRRIYKQKTSWVEKHRQLDALNELYEGGVRDVPGR